MKINTFSPIIFTLIIALFVSLSGCGPQSKDSYLDEYADFIEEVKDEHKGYTTEDWREKDAEFKQYAEEWAEKFEEELTLTDQLIVAKHAITYGVLSAKQQTGGILKEILQDEDVQELKDQLKYYAENEMEDDIERIVQEADEIGGEAIEAVEEILKELDVDIKVEINERNED